MGLCRDTAVANATAPDEALTPSPRARLFAWAGLHTSMLDSSSEDRACIIHTYTFSPKEMSLWAKLRQIRTLAAQELVGSPCCPPLLLICIRAFRSRPVAPLRASSVEETLSTHTQLFRRENVWVGERVESSCLLAV